MSDMSEGEALERFTEGLKKAASKAREIGALTGVDIWSDIAGTIDNIRNNGKVLAGMTALKRFEVLTMLDERQKNLTIPTDTLN